MELCFWFISNKEKKKTRVIYDCIAVPIKRWLLHSQRKHEEVTRGEFVGVFCQIDDYGSCDVQNNGIWIIASKKWWCSCKGRLTRTWLNFSVNFQAHFICKDPIFLPAQTEALRSVTHFQALHGVLEIFHHHWELTAHSLGFDVSEDTFRFTFRIEGIFMGHFGETQNRSGMHVPEVWIWRAKQKTGFVTNL